MQCIEEERNQNEGCNLTFKDGANSICSDSSLLVNTGYNCVRSLKHLLSLRPSHIQEAYLQSMSIQLSQINALLKRMETLILRLTQDGTNTLNTRELSERKAFSTTFVTINPYQCMNTIMMTIGTSRMQSVTLFTNSMTLSSRFFRLNASYSSIIIKITSLQPLDVNEIKKAYLKTTLMPC